jgi:hypothetical protein
MGIWFVSAKEGGIGGLPRTLGGRLPALGKNHRLKIRRNRPPRRARGFPEKWGWARVCFGGSGFIDLSSLDVYNWHKFSWLRKKSICGVALHPRRCGVPRRYASLLRFCAPCIWSFLHCHPNFDFSTKRNFHALWRPVRAMKV